MEGIRQEMTVRDALSFFSPAQQINLQFWAEEFGIPLREFHLGHIRTYESQRLREEPLYVVNAEVSTLWICSIPLAWATRSGDAISRCVNRTSFLRKNELSFPGEL
jgi:hypothetical protein